jgi:hypothetical protein
VGLNEMNFKDEMLSNFRDKTTVTTEEQEKRREELFNKALECIRMIKQSFVRAAQQGEYQEVNGKRVLTVTEFMPYEFWTHTETKIPAKFEKRLFGKVVQTVPQRIETRFFISPEKKQDYEQFLAFLREMAKPDDIEVGRVFFENKRTQKRVDVPYTHTDILSLTSYEWFFKIECRTCLPDTYSNDKPIEVEMTVSGDTKVTVDIDQMEGHEFEQFCADLLRKNGFDDVVVTQGSGDQGIDILAWRDGIKYGIQCKCYSSEVGNKAVQEAFAGKTYYQCHIGIVLTNRYFTRSAKDLAQTNSIVLWDRDKLISMMK